MERTKELGTEKIWKLLIKYSVPAVVATMVNAIYNIVDRIFIGKFAGESALAALTIAFPVMMIVIAFAALVNIGTASLLSIHLGEDDKRSASHVFANALSLTLVIMITMIIVVFTNFDGILSLFGAENEVLELTKIYLRIILPGSFFQTFAVLLNGTVRAQGHPKLSMIAMSSSAILNIILDYIFVVHFNMGVQGAALATIMGMFLGLSILLSFYIKGNSILKIAAKDFVPDWKVVKKIFSIGFAAFVGIIGSSISMTLLNRGLATYGGTGAIASLGAINSLFTLFIMPIFGVQEGMQPIIGYNYGAGKIHRSYRTLKIGIIIASVFACFVFVLLQVFPKTFLSMFLKRDSDTFIMAVQGLRMYIIMLPLISVNFMGITFFQATDNGKVSTVLGMMRHFLVLIPVLIILPPIIGLSGVWLSIPVADFVSILVTIIALIFNYNKNKTKGIISTEELINEFE